MGLLSSSNTTISFVYEVQEGDSSSDLDYASSTALNLNGGTVCGEGVYEKMGPHNAMIRLVPGQSSLSLIALPIPSLSRSTTIISALRCQDCCIESLRTRPQRH